MDRCSGCKTILPIGLLDDDGFAKLCGSCDYQRMTAGRFECPGCLKWEPLKEKRGGVCASCYADQQEIEEHLYRWQMRLWGNDNPTWDEIIGNV